jgi:ubiquinone/menaquinone biosynthesis C-methylase UbiE
MPQKFYERYWHAQEEELSDFKLKWPHLRPFIPLDEGKVIVDVGCGNGMVIAQMRKLNPKAKYIGLDVSETALKSAKRRLPDVDFKPIEDGEAFPLDAASVDFLFSSEVAEHVYDTKNYFAEMGRILRPGGQLLLTTPFHGLIKNLLLVLLGFDKHFNPTGPHVRFFSKKSLTACLNDAGFDVVKYGYYGRFYPVPHSIFVIAKKRV